MRLYDYSASGNCLKVRVTARLAGAELELVPTDIFAGATLSDDYARMNPLRQVPVLELDDGRHLTESNAICLFLAEGTGLVPDDPVERADVHRWLFFERAFTPSVGGTRFVRMTGRDVLLAPAVLDDMERTGRRLLRVLDAHLAERPFLAAGRLTVADVVVWSYAHVAADGGFELGDHARAWVDRVGAAPGVVDDLVPYPGNTRPGISRSIYG
jgi:glutathione S-transferase